MLAYYLHDLSPTIFELGLLKPRWYGFAYLLGFLGAYLLIKKLARDGMLRLQSSVGCLAVAKRSPTRGQRADPAVRTCARRARRCPGASGRRC